MIRPGKFFYRIFRIFLFPLKPKEDPMADFSGLKAAIQDLAAKVDTLIAKVNAPVPDEQPQVDEVTQAVQAVTAKIPA